MSRECAAKNDDGCVDVDRPTKTGGLKANACYCNEDLCNGEWTAVKLNTAECL